MAKQRAKEIATKGYSTIKVAKSPRKPSRTMAPKSLESPTARSDDSVSEMSGSMEVPNLAGLRSGTSTCSRSSGTSSNSCSRPSKPSHTAKKQSAIDAAIKKVEETIKKQNAVLSELRQKIQASFELSKVRLCGGQNEKIVALSYRRVKEIASQCSAMEKTIEGLKALEENIDGGYTFPETVDEEIAEILSYSGRIPTTKAMSDADLVSELKAKIAEEKSRTPVCSPPTSPPMPVIETKPAKSKKGFRGMFGKKKM